MVSFSQLMQCQPQKFNEAGQTYRRMAEGFGKVEGVFQAANKILSNNTDWVGMAQKQAQNRSETLTKGLKASGQETNTAGTVLTTLGTALTAAQTALRAAVAEAMTGPLIMTPEGQTIIPPWAYSWPACVEELPRLNALKAVVDVQIRAALTSATAADMTAAGAIAKLAVGQLIKDFGHSTAPSSTNQANAATTMGTPTTANAVYAPGSTAATVDTSANVQGVVTATTGASTNGATLNNTVQGSDWNGMSADGKDPRDTRTADANATGGQRVGGTVQSSDWNGMSADGRNAVDTRTATANAGGGQAVSGTIGAAAVGGSAATGLLAQQAAPQQVQTAIAREVTANGRRYVIYNDEVRTGGSVSWRARNPGNIRHGANYGAVPGVHAHAGANGTFAVFPDEQTGMAAITRVLHGYGHVTVADAMSTYAPSNDNNDPVAYAQSVSDAMGVTPQTYVDTLTPQQMDQFAQEIRRVEGWQVGTTYRLDDPNLPAAVRRAIQEQQQR